MPTGGFEHLARQICEQEGLTYGEPVGAGAFKQTFQVTSPPGELAGSQGISAGHLPREGRSRSRSYEALHSPWYRSNPSNRHALY